MPFLASTGNLDEVQITEISNLNDKLTELQKRKDTIIKTIEDQGKMTQELKDRIQEYTLSAIANYLRATELSVKEISNKLGFPNTSFLGKYVKEHLGCSPLEYRRQAR